MTDKIENIYTGPELHSRVCAKPCQPGNDPPETWCDELQPEVLRLRAENERLRAEREKIIAKINDGSMSARQIVESLRRWTRDDQA